MSAVLPAFDRVVLTDSMPLIPSRIGRPLTGGRGEGAQQACAVR